MTAAVTLAALTVAVPFLAALAGLVLAPDRRRPAAQLGIGAASIALACAIGLVFAVGHRTVDASRTWVRFGPLDVTLGVRVDAAVAFVAIAVGVVALAVQVYSVAYLDHDDRYAPYAAQISLFTAAMLLVLVSGDLIMLLVGWEVMGICSYLLIGHDRSLPEAPAAAVKAFIVTRVGDVGFLLGIALLGLGAGTFRISDVLATALTHFSPGRLTVVCLLLLAGAVGKSAQFPLHTWLPDAMAGPTPISALIHAATMVAAGVIVLVRLAPLFRAAPGLLAVIAVIASITMLLGALAATAQDDIKRVLAWSTVSQVAYMFAGFAVGLSSTALFHLLTHAAFKALLFLGAGCVIHAVGSNLMARMGGLRRAMPVTFVAMTVGLAALAGVPPFAGFFSKDAIIDAAASAARGAPEAGAARWVGTMVLVAALVTVVVTAWYATRLWLRTFFGDFRGELDRGGLDHAGLDHSGLDHGGLDHVGLDRGGSGHGAVHLADPPGLMRWPVIILTVPTAVLGFAGLSTGFARALDGPGSDRGALTQWNSSTLISLILVAVGVAGAWLSWLRDRAADPARMLGPVRPIFADAFRFDALQDLLVVRPVMALASAVRRGDESIVDGAVEGTGRGTRSIGNAVDVWHRGPLPRAATAVFSGTLLIVVTAIVTGGLR